jgi:NAD(P)-dependent dehydrogenase (short-subunit alcohol dehydrogenase family)
VRFTTSLTVLHPRFNIRVNCVCPDWVETPMLQRARNRLSDAEWAVVGPARLLQSDEIADAVLELVSDDSLAGRILVCRPDPTWDLLPAEGPGHV